MKNCEKCLQWLHEWNERRLWALFAVIILLHPLLVAGTDLHLVLTQPGPVLLQPGTLAAYMAGQTEIKTQGCPLAAYIHISEGEVYSKNGFSGTIFIMTCSVVIFLWIAFVIKKVKFLKVTQVENMMMKQKYSNMGHLYNLKIHIFLGK